MQLHGRNSKRLQLYPNLIPTEGMSRRIEVGTVGKTALPFLHQMKVGRCLQFAAESFLRSEFGIRLWTIESCNFERNTNLQSWIDPPQDSDSTYRFEFGALECLFSTLINFSCWLEPLTRFDHKCSRRYAIFRKTVFFLKKFRGEKYNWEGNFCSAVKATCFANVLKVFPEMFRVRHS